MTTPSTPTRERESTAGIAMGPGAGKFLFRIRQRLITNAYAPLIAHKRYGAVKLDLLLRCIALSPQHSRAREPGFVVWEWAYEDLYNLATTPPVVRAGRERSERQLRHLKRKWVGNQMRHLQELRLLRVTERRGGRPELVVL